MKFEKLGNIADIIAGQSPPSSTYNSEGNGIPFFQGKADYGEKYPSVRYWCTEPTKISLPDDILISMRAPVGPVNINTIESCIGRGLSAIRVKKNVSRDFIYFWLKQNQHIIAAKQTGSTFKAITQKILSEIVVPFPSYSDQLQIASILSKAENLIDQRKESIRLLDEFLKSTFLEMFGDPVRNEKGWHIGKFKDLANLDRKQVLPSEFTNEDFYIGLEDIEKETGNIIKTSSENAEDLKSSKFRFTPNHILYAKLRPYLNKVALPNQSGICSTDIFPVLPLKEKSNRFFICYLMRSKPFVTEMHSKSSGANLPRASASVIENFKTYQPPIELQTQFAQIVEKTESLKTQYQQSLQELENLYGSLSQKAFKGELTTSKAVKV
jgi:type I restriction enzyme S subunit